MNELTTYLPTLAGVLLLAALTIVVLKTFKVSRPWQPSVAILRGVVQLALISFVLTGIIQNPYWIGLALVVMFSVATTVATRRTGFSFRKLAQTGTSILAGAGIAIAIIFLTGSIEFSARYVLAIGAIIIGGAMSVATLSARLFTKSVHDHWDQVEAWLSLGATPRESTIALARSAVYEALIPATDQTKTTGLVVLPGAFVGAIFGGLSPLEAGQFQIVVLAAILAAGAITAVTTVLWMGNVKTKPTLPN